ncbi:MAG: hypothetical protein ACFFF4_12570 [Candidatus Thorarchaeota archaeon]
MNNLPIETKSLDDIQSRGESIIRIKPRVLDKVVGQILLPGQISVIHGTERFPLTAIAHVVAIGGVRKGNSAIYLDSGSNFSPQLARVLADDNDGTLLNRIKVGEVFNLQNLMEFATEVRSVENISVVIIDSLTGILNMSSPPGSKTRQRRLFAALEILRELVIEINSHLFITDHATKHWQTGQHRPIGGNVIEHAVDSVLTLNTLDEIEDAVSIRVERCSITPNPGGVIVKISHKGIRSLKSV